jgi:protein-S-isoprenylcysteine O-methyltransferase Ste14
VAKKRDFSLLKSLASIKLAVVVILSLGTMTAWGTFVEAKYNDAEAAAKIVYHSPLMYAIMALFAINLTAVMIDRWPWRERHTGFILAHIGLLTLLLGAVMTKYLGVDGSMSIGLGETAHQVVVGQTDLTLYSSMDAAKYTKVDDREVDFFRHRPTEQKPYEVMMPQGSLKVLKYYPYAIRDQKIVDSGDANTGAALRFQIQNKFVNQTEWVLQPALGRMAVKDFGPAQILFGKVDSIDPTRNTIVLTPKGDGTKDSDEIAYEIHTARGSKPNKKGIVKAGDTIETGWMGELVVRVLKYIPHAKEQVTFNEIDQATPLTTSAILVEFQPGSAISNEKKTQHWLALNSMLKLFTDQAVYILAFANRRLNLDFNIKLEKFHVGRYQGTMTASSYESQVNVSDIVGTKTISMNEPLKHAGFTFYQSSFSEDERGQPTASILSVNRDPGRWVKYVGCLLIVFGSIHLFWFKRKNRQKPSPAAQFPVAP